jgi:hypothetical protein
MPNQVEKMVMVVPVDGHVHEAQRVAKECWRHRHECVQRGIVGHFQLQHHDRDDDCDHAIAERDQPVLFHCTALTAT